MDAVRSILGWCVVLDYAILLLWFLTYVLARERLQRLHGRWFRLQPVEFDLVHFGGMGLFKLGIFLFHLVPYLALRIAA